MNKDSKKGGFIELIILILIALFIMKYLGVTVSDVIVWFKTTFADVLR